MPLPALALAIPAAVSAGASLYGLGQQAGWWGKQPKTVDEDTNAGSEAFNRIYDPMYAKTLQGASLGALQGAGYSPPVVSGYGQGQQTLYDPNVPPPMPPRKPQGAR